MIQGNWWIPDNEEKKFFGVLSFIDNEIRLELTGYAKDASNNPSTVEEIHGLTFGSSKEGISKDIAGKFLVLQNCISLGTSTNYGGVVPQYAPASISHFRATTAYVIRNSRYVKNLAPEFHEIWVGFSHLPDFAATAGHWVEETDFLDEQRMRGWKASFKESSFPNAIIDGKIVEFKQSFSTHGDLKRECMVRPTIHLKITSEEALPLPKWQTEFITPFQHFLTLATTRVNHVTDIKAFHCDNLEEYDLGEGQTTTAPILTEIITSEIP